MKLSDRLKDKTIYANDEMIIIVGNKKILGVLTMVEDKVAKVAGEKGIGTLLYYTALALKNGIRPNAERVTDDASKVWEFKFKDFPKKRLEGYDHEKEFLNYKYMPPSEDFIAYFMNKVKPLKRNGKVEDAGWKYVEKSMSDIYGVAEQIKGNNMKLVKESLNEEDFEKFYQNDPHKDDDFEKDFEKRDAAILNRKDDLGDDGEGKVLVLDTIAAIPRLPQAQYSLDQQLFELGIAADKLGLYDAATWLRDQGK